MKVKSQEATVTKTLPSTRTNAASTTPVSATRQHRLLVSSSRKCLSSYRKHPFSENTSNNSRSVDSKPIINSRSYNTRGSTGTTAAPELKLSSELNAKKYLQKGAQFRKRLPFMDHVVNQENSSSSSQPSDSASASSTTPKLSSSSSHPQHLKHQQHLDPRPSTPFSLRKQIALALELSRDPIQSHTDPPLASSPGGHQSGGDHSGEDSSSSVSSNPQPSGVKAASGTLATTPQQSRSRISRNSSPSVSSSGKKLHRNNKGETALHIAAIRGDFVRLEELLSGSRCDDGTYSINVDVEDNAGWTPLHEACNRGHTQAVRVLISHGANVNATSECGTTPLIDASANGHTSIVKLLLKHGANALPFNRNGTNAFSCAATPTIEELLKASLNPNPKPSFSPNLPIAPTVPTSVPTSSLLPILHSPKKGEPKSLLSKDLPVEAVFEPDPKPPPVVLSSALETTPVTTIASSSSTSSKLGITAISELKSVIHLISLNDSASDSTRNQPAAAKSELVLAVQARPEVSEVSIAPTIVETNPQPVSILLPISTPLKMSSSSVTSSAPSSSSSSSSSFTSISSTSLALTIAPSSTSSSTSSSISVSALAAPSQSTSLPTSSSTSSLSTLPSSAISSTSVSSLPLSLASTTSTSTVLSTVSSSSTYSVGAAIKALEASSSVSGLKTLHDSSVSSISSSTTTLTTKASVSSSPKKPPQAEEAQQSSISTGATTVGLASHLVSSITASSSSASSAPSSTTTTSSQSIRSKDGAGHHSLRGRKRRRSGGSHHGDRHGEHSSLFSSGSTKKSKDKEKDNEPSSSGLAEDGSTHHTHHSHAESSKTAMLSEPSSYHGSGDGRDGSQLKVPPIRIVLPGHHGERGHHDRGGRAGDSTSGNSPLVVMNAHPTQAGSTTPGSSGQGGGTTGHSELLSGSGATSTSKYPYVINSSSTMAPADAHDDTTNDATVMNNANSGEGGSAGSSGAGGGKSTSHRITRSSQRVALQQQKHHSSDNEEQLMGGDGASVTKPHGIGTRKKKNRGATGAGLSGSSSLATGSGSGTSGSSRGGGGANGAPNSSNAADSSYSAANSPTGHGASNGTSENGAGGGEDSNGSNGSGGANSATNGDVPNPVNSNLYAYNPSNSSARMYLTLRDHVKKRRLLMSQITPKTIPDFEKFRLNTNDYLLQSNVSQKASSRPDLPPASLIPGSPLHVLFTEQERERHKLRLRHQVEQDKMRLAIEQEYLRIHCRAAQANCGQSLPLSVCTYLKDEELYNLMELEKDPAADSVIIAQIKADNPSFLNHGPSGMTGGIGRIRFNARMLLSWQRDADDKWNKLKTSMLNRQRIEAESTGTIQRLKWEWKVGELADSAGTPGVPALTPTGPPKFAANGFIDHETFVPTVRVLDDFDLLPS